MKKNKMMRSASALLVMVLLTTSVISGTFAKYTTQDSAYDSARVAKWGVELQVAGDLYGMNYLTTTNTKTSDTTGISVQSNADGKNVVAPGTKNDGTGFDFSLNGQPEVSSQVSATIKAQNIFLNAGSYAVMIPTDVVTAENFAAMKENGLYTGTKGDTYTVAGATYDSEASYFTLEDAVSFTGNYYPVIYTLTGATNVTTGTCTSDSLNEIAAAIVGSIGTATTAVDSSTQITTYTVTGAVLAPNTFLADTVKLGNENIKWEWAFNNDGCTDDEGNFCKADTILGNLMAKDSLNGEVVMLQADSTYKAPTAFTDYCLETSLDINIKVTQVD